MRIALQNESRAMREEVVKDKSTHPICMEAVTEQKMNKENVTRGALTDILKNEAKEQARRRKERSQAKVESDESQARKKNLKNSKCKSMRGRSEHHWRGSEVRLRGISSTSKGMHENEAINRLLGRHGPR